MAGIKNIHFTPHKLGGTQIVSEGALSAGIGAAVDKYRDIQATNRDIADKAAADAEAKRRWELSYGLQKAAEGRASEKWDQEQAKVTRAKQAKQAAANTQKNILGAMATGKVDAAQFGIGSDGEVIATPELAGNKLTEAEHLWESKYFQKPGTASPYQQAYSMYNESMGGDTTKSQFDSFVAASKAKQGNLASDKAVHQSIIDSNKSSFLGKKAEESYDAALADKLGIDSGLSPSNRWKEVERQSNLAMKKAKEDQNVYDKAAYAQRVSADMYKAGATDSEVANKLKVIDALYSSGANDGAMTDKQKAFARTNQEALKSELAVLNTTNKSKIKDGKVSSGGSRSSSGTPLFKDGGLAREAQTILETEVTTADGKSRVKLSDYLKNNGVSLSDYAKYVEGTKDGGFWNMHFGSLDTSEVVEDLKAIADMKKNYSGIFKASPGMSEDFINTAHGIAVGKLQKKYADKLNLNDTVTVDPAAKQAAALRKHMGKLYNVDSAKLSGNVSQETYDAPITDAPITTQPSEYEFGGGNTIFDRLERNEVIADTKSTTDGKREKGEISSNQPKALKQDLYKEGEQRHIQELNDIKNAITSKIQAKTASAGDIDKLSAVTKELSMSIGEFNRDYPMPKKVNNKFTTAQGIQDQASTILEERSKKELDDAKAAKAVIDKFNSEKAAGQRIGEVIDPETGKIYRDDWEGDIARFIDSSTNSNIVRSVTTPGYYASLPDSDKMRVIAEIAATALPGAAMFKLAGKVGGKALQETMLALPSPKNVNLGIITPKPNVF
jgi:hypothetical protein